MTRGDPAASAYPLANRDAHHSGTCILQQGQGCLTWHEGETVPVTCDGAGHNVPGAAPSPRYLAANRRPTSPAIGSFFL